jgi:hypothetical protein
MKVNLKGTNSKAYSVEMDENSTIKEVKVKLFLI